MKKRARCPVCAAPVELDLSSPAFPFCSARCKRIDLGKWLGEAYAVPAEEAEDPMGPARPRGDGEA